MSKRTNPWPSGLPCWTDLVTPDVKAAQAFYSSVIGWTFQDADEEYGGYSIAQTDGAAAAGIGPLPEGAHTAWTLYFASDNADKTAELITENGGTVLVEPVDVGPLGRMLIATDPSGAAFGVWQAKSTIGAGIVNEPGALMWEDLRSKSPDASREFFAALFDYSYENVPAANDDYKIFMLPGEELPAGGMGGMMGMDGAPSHWVVYFAVSEVDTATTAAEAGGGSILVPTFDSPYGRMALLSDPAGAMFFVIEPVPGSQPDRGN